MAGLVEVVVGGDIFTPMPAANPAQLVVGHGVNTQGVMGAGFAAQVAARFPSVLETYAQACRHHDPRTRLVPGRTQLVPVPGFGYLANIASQDYPGAHAREEWLRSGLLELYALLNSSYGGCYEVRVPLIGAGYGGLDPVRAAGILLEHAHAQPHSIRTTLFLRERDVHTSAVVQALGVTR